MPFKSQFPHRLGYTIREACELSSLGRTTIYKLIAYEQLRVARLGRRTIVLAESLHALIGGED